MVTKETAARIVRFAAGAENGVSLEDISAVPPILSLLCRELNEQRLKDKAAEIAFSEDDDRIKDILDQFYQRCLIGLPACVSEFIEEELVSFAGYRLQSDEQTLLLYFTGKAVPADGGPREVMAHFSGKEEALKCASDLIPESSASPRFGDE